MTKRHRTIDPLADVLRSQQEEIKKYKWIESEKAGKDIGWERACREWLQIHFPDWKQYAWQKSVQDAVQTQAVLSRRSAKPQLRKTRPKLTQQSRVADTDKSM